MYNLCYCGIDISARGFGTEIRGNSQVSTQSLKILSRKRVYARVIGHQGNVRWFIVDSSGYVLNEGVVQGTQIATPSIVVDNDSFVSLVLQCESFDTPCIARGFISKDPIRHGDVPAQF